MFFILLTVILHRILHARRGILKFTSSWNIQQFEKHIHKMESREFDCFCIVSYFVCKLHMFASYNGLFSFIYLMSNTTLKLFSVIFTDSIYNVYKCFFFCGLENKILLLFPFSTGSFFSSEFENVALNSLYFTKITNAKMWLKKFPILYHNLF